MLTFAELHDRADANEYGGLCEDGFIERDDNGDMSDATMQAAARIQDALDQWLKAGRPDQYSTQRTKERPSNA